jgi:hypothetical protein
MRDVKESKANFLICGKVKRKFSRDWGHLSFKGKIEHVRAHNKCLSDKEVEDLK